jgi:hypothetical protein
MLKTNSWWRATLVVACLAGSGALLSPIAMAQGQPPTTSSGAAVETGGIQRTAPGPVVLPNTGGGPAEDATSLAIVFVLGGAAAIGTGVYARRRLLRLRVED